MLTESTQFSQNDHPSSTDLWIPLLQSAKLNAYFMEILQPLSHFGNKSLFGWLGLSPLFGNDEVATEQLTAVVDARVDVTFMLHNDAEIS